MSYAQEQLWFLDQLAQGQSTYNVPAVYSLHGDLDVTALRRAVALLARRHAVLRATINALDGRPFQTYLPEDAAGLDVADLTGMPDADRETAAERIVRDTVRAPFDLAAGPLCRFRLVRLSEVRHILCVNMHHIVSDGWSLGILLRELSQAYEALRAGDPPALPDAGHGYGDFAGEQRRRFAGGELDRHLDFWQRRLGGLPVLELPADRPRPATPTHAGGSLVYDFPVDLVTAARRAAREHNVSFFMLLAGAFGLLLARYTGQDDIPLGTTALGRTDPDLEDVVGLFVNMVVLRADLTGNPTFREILSRIRETTLDAFEHQDAPFERVVERLQPVRDGSRNPLFQVSVQLLGASTSGDDFQLPSLVVRKVPVGAENSRFDLSLNFVESTDGLQLQVEYATDLFDHWRIEGLARHLERVLAAVVADPAIRLSDVELLDAQERAELLAAGTGPTDDFRREPVHVIIAERAREAPDAPAVIFAGQELSYAELDRRADRLARYLRRLGVQHEDVVAVAFERGLDVFVAMLGVLKAGAAFVILDIAHPVNRLEFILDDTDAAVILTDSALTGSLPDSGRWTHVCLDRDWPTIEAEPADEPLVEIATGDSLGYVLFTSGSTGKPKGAAIEHRALMCYLRSFVGMFELGPGDRMLQLCSLAFDLAMAEIFSAWTSGAALVTDNRETLSQSAPVAELMRRERITYVGAAPAMLALLEPGSFPDLRSVLVGGDTFTAELVNSWNLPGRKFVNGYGPAEITVGCTMYLCEHVVWRACPPIGYPLHHRLLYLVDRWGNLVPRGVPGEVLIGGDEGLARGYLKRPELNKERFIPDPFRDHGRVYRSGDLVRWSKDFCLEFLGRIDTQVKLRGLRIELEEIETVIAAHPGVGNTVVALREDRPGDKRLVAYYTVADDKVPGPAELREFVGGELPTYMVPSAFVRMDALPLSVTGKIDRRSLPPPPAAAEDEGREFVPPVTPAERRVAAIFEEVLSTTRVSADDDFFARGGNSLQAMQVISRINKAFGTSVGVRALYGAATVREFARSLATEPLPEAPVPGGPPDVGALIGLSLDELLTRVEEMTDLDAERLLQRCRARLLGQEHLEADGVGV